MESESARYRFLWMFLRPDQLAVAVILAAFGIYLTVAGHPLGLVIVVCIVLAAWMSNRARGLRES